MDRVMQLQRVVRRATSQPRLSRARFYSHLPLFSIIVGAVIVMAGCFAGDILAVVLPLSARTLSVLLVAFLALICGWKAEGWLARVPPAQAALFPRAQR